MAIKGINLSKTSCFTLFLVLVGLTGIAQNSEKPSVLFIISDQWSAFFLDGSKNYAKGIQTQYINKLAEQRMQFTQSYCNFPLCTSARVSIYTMLYAHKHGMIDNEEIFKIFLDGYRNRDDIPTMDEVLKQAGYKTTKEETIKD